MLSALLRTLWIGLLFGALACNRRTILDDGLIHSPEPEEGVEQVEKPLLVAPDQEADGGVPERSAFFEGRRAMERGEWTRAANLFLDTIRVEGDTVEVHDLLGQVHWKLDNLPRARTHFLKALQWLRAGRIRDARTVSNLQEARLKQLLEAVEIDIEMAREARRARTLGSGR